jgi:hypothetical protein
VESDELQRAVTRKERKKRRQERKRLANLAIRANEEPARTQARMSEPPPPPRRSLPRRIPSLVKRAYTTGVALLSLVVLQYKFRPDLTIEPYASKNPRSPFGQLFYVQNSNMFPVYDVKPSCGLEDVRMANGNGLSNFSLTTDSDAIAELKPGAKISVDCRISTDGLFTKAKVSIWARYRAPFGWKTCKSVRFAGVATADNGYIWTPRGTGSCDSK